MTDWRHSPAALCPSWRWAWCERSCCQGNHCWAHTGCAGASGGRASNTHPTGGRAARSRWGTDAPHTRDLRGRAEGSSLQEEAELWGGGRADDRTSPGGRRSSRWVTGFLLRREHFGKVFPARLTLEQRTYPLTHWQALHSSSHRLPWGNCKPAWRHDFPSPMTGENKRGGEEKEEGQVSIWPFTSCRKSTKTQSWHYAHIKLPHEHIVLLSTHLNCLNIDTELTFLKGTHTLDSEAQRVPEDKRRSSRWFRPCRSNLRRRETTDTHRCLKEKLNTQRIINSQVLKETNRTDEQQHQKMCLYPS